MQERFACNDAFNFVQVLAAGDSDTMASLIECTSTQSQKLHLKQPKYVPVLDRKMTEKVAPNYNNL